MFWKLHCEKQTDNARLDSEHVDGRFVLHRHQDALGPHLDLRIEQEGYLAGWRIDASSLEDTPWATEKSPHAVRWLDHDGDAVREDFGVYSWIERSSERCILQLEGWRGAFRLAFSREPGLAPREVREICRALKEHRVEAQDLPRLIADGLTSRQRAIERLCGLGRELDGNAFDPEVWRKALNGLSLDEIHAQLRAFEVRFDRKYPPRPMSQPEALPTDAEDVRTDLAFAIAREGR